MSKEIEPIKETELIEKYISTDSDINDLVNEWIPTKICEWCKSNDVKFPIMGYRICNKCGKHAIFYHRFHYIEEKVPYNTNEKVIDADGNTSYVSGVRYKNQEITDQIVQQTILDAEDLYDTNNRESGTRYYLVKKLADRL